MLAAVKGYYDGESIRALEKVNARKNQKVVITILDEYIEDEKHSVPESARGMLAEYANPALWEQEEGAWERAVNENYDFA